MRFSLGGHETMPLRGAGRSRRRAGMAERAPSEKIYGSPIELYI